MFGGEALCLSLRSVCRSGVYVEECILVCEGEAIVFWMLRTASRVREEEAVDEVPSEPSVLSVLLILLSRSGRRRGGVEKFSSFILLSGILMALLPGA